MSYTVKSCGKQHPHCKVCRPELNYSRWGIKMPESHKQAMSERLKQLWTNPEYRVRMTESARYERTDGTRIKQAEVTAQNHIKGVYFKGPTCLEYALQLLLEDAGLDFEAQVRFGRYVVDAFVLSENLAFEADGMFWHHHQNKEREAKRDEALLQSGIAAVIHLNDEDLDPWTVK